MNYIHRTFTSGVKKLLFLGSIVYPKMLIGTEGRGIINWKIEATNEPAIAKIAGIKLCESFNQYGKSYNIDYRCIMPTNLYGHKDNYHPENSHVIPGLIYRFHKAKINKISKFIFGELVNQNVNFICR